MDRLGWSKCLLCLSFLYATPPRQHASIPPRHAVCPGGASSWVAINPVLPCVSPLPGARARPTSTAKISERPGNPSLALSITCAGLECRWLSLSFLRQSIRLGVHTLFPTI
ncbi:hypothetical protein ACLOJK_010509 [Asimina triloba]